MIINVKRASSPEELMSWREEVIANVFGIKAGHTLLEANLNYYKTHIPDESHVAIVASCNGVDCGCGGVCFSEELPSPDNPGGKCAYLMNIYVRPLYRNKGVAHTIVKHLLDIALERGCDKIYLETTAEGKAVYNSLGFRDMPDMMILWHRKLK